MANYIQPDVTQYQIVTLNFSELFPEDHPTSRLLAIMQKLDLSNFDKNYLNDKKGRPAFPVDRLLAIMFYSILNGNISMRTIARDIDKRAELIYLSGGLVLDHSTLSVFRKRHAQAIENLFHEVVFLGIESNFIDFDTVCIDSTKIKANTNRKDIGTQEELKIRYENVKKYSKKKYNEWLEANELEEKKEIENIRKRLEKQEERILAGIEFLEKHKERKQVHLTDHDASFQKDSNKGFLIGYQAQIAVDAKKSMIVHKELETNKSDVKQTVDLIEKVENIKEKAKTENVCKSEEQNQEKAKEKTLVQISSSASKREKEKERREDKIYIGCWLC